MGTITRQPHFWLDAIDHKHDPIWVLRYLRWRMNGPRLRHIKRRFGGPSMGTCIATTLEYVYREAPGEDDERSDLRKFYMECID